MDLQQSGSSNPPLQVFYILEALEMQAEHLGQLLHLDALLCLLQAATGITAELVLCVQGLSGTAGPNSLPV